MSTAAMKLVRGLAVGGTVCVLLLAATPAAIAAQGGARQRQAAAGAPKAQAAPVSPGGAAPDANVRPPNRGVFLARALRQVDLTPEQFRSIRQIRGRYDTRMRDIGRRFIDARRQLDQSLANENPALDRAHELTAEISKLAGERSTTRTLIELEVIQTLNPQQRAKLRELRGAAREQFKAGAGAALRNRRRNQAGVAAQPGAAPDSDVDAEDPDEDGLSVPDVTGKPLRSDKVRKPPIRQLLDRLQLTPEQQTRMRQLRRQHAPLMRESNWRFRDAQRAVDDALLGDTLDVELVKRLAGTLGEADAARTLERLNAEIEVRSILTPAQRAVWAEARRPGPGAADDDAP